MPELNAGVGINISRGGMALALAEKLQVGTLLRISAFISNDDAVDATAIVVWEHVHEYEQRAGLRFLGLSQHALSALTRFIEALAEASA